MQHAKASSYASSLWQAVRQDLSKCGHIFWLIADHVLPLQEALAVDRQEVMRRSGHANRFAPCKDVADYARQVTVYLRLSLPCEEMHAA